MGPLAVHAAVLDEAAGRAVLELDDVAPALAAVRAEVITWHAAHSGVTLPLLFQVLIRACTPRSEQCARVLPPAVHRVWFVEMACRRDCK